MTAILDRSAAVAKGGQTLALPARPSRQALPAGREVTLAGLLRERAASTPDRQAFLFLTDYTLLLHDWRGYLLAGFSLVWVANIYMGLFGLIRIDLKKERAEIQVLEEKVEK